MGRAPNESVAPLNVSLKILWLLLRGVVCTILISGLGLVGFVCFSGEPIVLSDSEEEEVVILEPQELPRKTR